MAGTAPRRWLLLALLGSLWAAPATAQMRDQAERQLGYCWDELAAGELERAQKSAESALRLDPGLYEAMICKAEVYEAQGDLPRARIVVGAYLELRVGLAPSERATAVMARLGVQPDGTVVEPEPAAPEFGDVPPPPLDAADDPPEPSTRADAAPIATPEREEEAPRAAEPQPGAWKSWDPAVYRWGADRAGGSFLIGGVGLGLLILGDQAATAAAVDQGVRGRSPALSTFITINHLPLGDGTTFVGNAGAGAFLGEFFFDAGLILAVPGLLGPIPHLVLATAGMDLRTVKAAAGIGGGVSLLTAGVCTLSRVFWLYSQEWDNQTYTGQRFHFVAPGVIGVAAGVAGLTVGTIDLLVGVLYAAGAVEAKEDDDLLPSALRWGPPRVTPWMAADERGGSAGVLVSWRAR
jgi:hypothetical protein